MTLVDFHEADACYSELPPWPKWPPMATYERSPCVTSVVVDFPQPEGVPKWLTPRYETMPLLLKQYDRWMFWKPDGEGKKTPRSITDQKDRNIDPNNPAKWSSWDKLIAASQKYCGPGFALGSVNSGPTFAGIDLDECRDPKTGVIQEWAWKVIHTVNSYTEISPSGTGVKIFITGALREEDTKQDKVYQLEIYDRKRYFTVTGHHLAGPTTVEPRETELRTLDARQRSTDLVELVKLFGLFKQDRGDKIDIFCPWAEDHSTPDGSTDCSLHRDKDGVWDWFKCLHGSHSETKKLPEFLKLFPGVKGEHTGFICNAKGAIIADHQENIRHALEKLSFQLSYNVFAEKMLITKDGRTEVLDDALLDRTWLLVDEECHFRGTFAFFKTVVFDTARRWCFHPVQVYLNSLTWDGVPRIDRWLETYGGAEDSEYLRAISAIVLMAAVRRIRQPGCKYDEMLVLESEQGLDKSSALRALCPNDDWFSDDLPLNVDAKRLIEATLGKWIIEASDLAGKRKADREHLKSLLSRQEDGPVRMAYMHIPGSRRRHFIILGTTNSDAYLNDPTGLGASGRCGWVGSLRWAFGATVINCGPKPRCAKRWGIDSPTERLWPPRPRRQRSGARSKGGKNRLRMFWIIAPECRWAKTDTGSVALGCGGGHRRI